MFDPAFMEIDTIAALMSLMRNVVIVLLLSLLLTGLELAEASAAAALGAPGIETGVTAGTGSEVGKPSTKRLCWRKVLPPRSGDTKPLSSSSCNSEAKHPCDIVLVFPPLARAPHVASIPPSLSGHETGRLFRPPIA